MAEYVADPEWISSWHLFFETIRSNLLEADIKRHTVSFLVAESIVGKLEYCKGALLGFRDAVLDGREDDVTIQSVVIKMDRLLECLCQACSEWTEKYDILSRADVVNDMMDTSHVHLISFGFSGGRGRPKILIDLEQIIALRTIGLTWTKIANFIGVSRFTLHRRWQESGLPDIRTFTSISDDQLDIVILRVKNELPHIGERLVLGYLHRIGIFVPRERVRLSIHRVDPINTALRWNKTISRRTYSVPGPNSIWHIGMIMSKCNCFTYLYHRW